MVGIICCWKMGLLVVLGKGGFSEAVARVHGAFNYDLNLFIFDVLLCE